MDIDQRVDQFVKLRDIIRKMEAEFEEKIKPYKDTRDQLALALLQMLESTKQESARTVHGTVYKTKKQSVSIADKEAFWDFVVANKDWDLVDKRANVTGCVDFAEKHNAMPPGVNYSSIFTVGVRRS